jgi:hypothetical protein
MVYHCGETNDTVCREQNVKLHIDNTIPIKHKSFHKGSSTNHQEPDRSNHTNNRIKILLGRIIEKKSNPG